jgi:hypothetical protein
MPRIDQSKAERGSQRWLQVLVNERPHVFAREFLPQVGYSPSDAITWLSPLREEDYAEYRDEDFVRKLGVTLSRHPLGEFWPSRGPVWDGLALGPGGEPILVEAKAHIPELHSPASAASEASLARIRESLAQTRQAFGSTAEHDWSGPFYQYTNRLAHLYLLRSLNGLPAYLVFLCFVNARDVKGPSSVAEWKGALQLVETILGVRKSDLRRYVIHVFVDVRELEVAPRA